MSGLYPIRQQESNCTVTSKLHTSNEPSHVAATLVSQFSASLLAVLHSIKRNFTSRIEVCATFKQSVPGFCHCPSLAPTCTLRSSCSTRWSTALQVLIYGCSITTARPHCISYKKKKSCINTLTFPVHRMI